MRIVTLFLFSLLFSNCSERNQSADLPDTLCQMIERVHEESPFQLDTATNSIILGNFIGFYYPNSQTFKEFYITLWDSSFQCGKLNFKLIEGTIDYSPSYKYIHRISIDYDNPVEGKFLLSRSTFRNDTLTSIIGVEDRLGEHFYLSKMNGKWIIDSLTYDMIL